MSDSAIKQCLAMLLSVLMVCVPHVVAAQNDRTFVILISEKVRGFGSGFEQPGQAEVTMASHFRSLGFQVVDPETVRANLSRQNAELLLAGDEKAARIVAIAHDADYSIIGTASSRPAGGELFNTQMKSIQATLTAKVIRNTDSRVVAVGSAQTAKVHIDELQGGALAIEEAAQQLANQLSAKLQRSLDTSQSSQSTHQTLHISGLVSYQHLNFILKFLDNDLQGITHAELKQYSNGVAEIGLTGSVASTDVALQIAVRKFKSFKLEPYKVSRERIDVLVKMKP